MKSVTEDSNYWKQLKCLSIEYWLSNIVAHVMNTQSLERMQWAKNIKRDKIIFVSKNYITQEEDKRYVSLYNKIYNKKFIIFIQQKYYNRYIQKCNEEFHRTIFVLGDRSVSFGI